MQTIQVSEKKSSNLCQTYDNINEQIESMATTDPISDDPDTVHAKCLCTQKPTLIHTDHNVYLYADHNICVWHLWKEIQQKTRNKSQKFNCLFFVPKEIWYQQMQMVKKAFAMSHTTISFNGW